MPRDSGKHHLKHPANHQYCGPDDPVKNRKYYEDTKVTPHVDIGYDYPGCKLEQLQELDHADEMCDRFINKWVPVSMSEAKAELLEWLAKPRSDGSKEAIARLRSAWTSKHWSPDIAMKSFRDIDRAYFKGYLRGRVRLRWVGSTQRLRRAVGPKYKYTWGCTTLDCMIPVTQARIFLNAEKIFLTGEPTISSRRETFGTLVHECVHAYLLTSAGAGAFNAAEDQFDADPGHGRYFQAVAAAVNRQTVKELGLEVLWNKKHR